jgi:hypothetical protein
LRQCYQNAAEFEQAPGCLLRGATNGVDDCVEIRRVIGNIRGSVINDFICAQRPDMCYVTADTVVVTFAPFSLAN